MLSRGRLMVSLVNKSRTLEDSTTHEGLCDVTRSAAAPSQLYGAAMSLVNEKFSSDNTTILYDFSDIMGSAAAPIELLNDIDNIDNTIMPLSDELFSSVGEIENIAALDKDLINDPEWLPEEAETIAETNQEFLFVSEENLLQLKETSGESVVKRRRVAKKSEWHDIKNKILREKGKAYTGWTKPKGESGKRGKKETKGKWAPLVLLPTVVK